MYQPLHLLCDGVEARGPHLRRRVEMHVEYSLLVRCAWPLSHLVAGTCRKPLHTPPTYVLSCPSHDRRRFRSLIPSYIRDSSVAVVVYDVSSAWSRSTREQWLGRVCMATRGLLTDDVVAWGRSWDARYLQVPR